MYTIQHWAQGWSCLAVRPEYRKEANLPILPKQNSAIKGMRMKQACITCE